MTYTVYPAKIVEVSNAADELLARSTEGPGAIIVRVPAYAGPPPPSGSGVPDPEVAACSSPSFTVAKNFNVGYQVLGGVVVLDIPDICGTSDETTFTIHGLPEFCPTTGVRLWPSAPKNIISGVAGTAGYTGTNVRTPGFAVVQPDGVIQVYCNLNGNVWPNTGGYMEFLAAVGFYFLG